jgi:hypothetical protein
MEKMQKIANRLSKLINDDPKIHYSVSFDDCHLWIDIDNKIYRFNSLTLEKVCKFCKKLNAVFFVDSVSCIQILIIREYLNRR